MTARKGTNWQGCAESKNCTGAVLPGQTKCLVHVPDSARDDFVRNLKPGDSLDLSGTSISDGILASILAAMTSDGRPVVGTAQFDNASFGEGPRFNKVWFRQSASFDGATFKGQPLFAWARFEDAAVFAGATFEDGAMFANATFGGRDPGMLTLTMFDGATFWGGVTSFYRARFLDEPSFGSTLFGARRTGGDAESDHYALTLGETGQGEYAVTGGPQLPVEDNPSAIVAFNGATVKGRVFFDSAHFGTKPNFNGMALSSQAIFRDATFRNGGNLKGLNLKNASFRDARLPRVRFDDAILHGASLVRADLKRASLVRAELQGAELSAVELQGADLTQARLQRAILSRANLEGATLAMAQLAGVDLRGALLNGATVLNRARLFSDSDATYVGRAILADVRWNQVSVSSIDWHRCSRLGDDPYASPGLRLIPSSGFIRCLGRKFWPFRLRPRKRKNWPWRPGRWQFRAEIGLLTRRPRSERALRRLARIRTGRSAERRRLKDELPNAVRANRQIATLLGDQGLREDAARLEYRARALARRLSPDPVDSRIGQVQLSLTRLGSAILDLTCGYGFKPGRILVAYLTTVAAFALLYNWLGPLTDSQFKATGANAIWFSFIAIHGRGVVGSGGVGAGSQLLVVAAFEAILGLLIEAVFVATLLRWLFRD